MHFVSAQSEEDQVKDVIAYLRENMRASLRDQKNQAFAGFEDTLDALEEKQDYSGLLDYLLSLKSELVQLQLTHKNTPITI